MCIQVQKAIKFGIPIVAEVLNGKCFFLLKCSQAFLDALSVADGRPVDHKPYLLELNSQHHSSFSNIFLFPHFQSSFYDFTFSAVITIHKLSVFQIRLDKSRRVILVYTSAICSGLSFLTNAKFDVINQESIVLNDLLFHAKICLGLLQLLLDFLTVPLVLFPLLSWRAPALFAGIQQCRHTNSILIVVIITRVASSVA